MSILFVFTFSVPSFVLGCLLMDPCKCFPALGNVLIFTPVFFFPILSLSLFFFWGIFICMVKGLMLKLKLQYFGHLMRRVDSLEDSDAVRDWGQEEKGTTEDEMAGWHH